MPAPDDHHPLLTLGGMILGYLIMTPGTLTPRDCQPSEMGTVEAAIAGKQAIGSGERVGPDGEIGQDSLSRPAALPIRSPRAPRLDSDLAIHVVEADADVLEGSHAVLRILVRGRHLRPDRGAGDDAALLQASVDGRA